MCQRYTIKHSESGQWALLDIKRAYGKMQCLWTNTKKDGLSVILVKQIVQHLQKCETDKLQREITAEKAKNVKEDKERLSDDSNKDINKHADTKRNTKVRLAPVIVKNRWTEAEIDNEEEFEENGEPQTRTVKKLVKKNVPYRTYQTSYSRTS
ncbi:hypothetical protein H4Q32_011426 [Labeo rohita]|uniref:Uncharacterized protein n=1 Tax=Labeo rohita TaxID=84645 RepID=A0ABQ8LVM1_LABRO|nr:hypothetical protein H4Q32_011426 [Labeo rohita]